MSSNLTQARSFKPQFVMYKELGYGESWTGYGGFDCRMVACQIPKVQFIVKVQSWPAVQDEIDLGTASAYLVTKRPSCL